MLHRPRQFGSGRPSGFCASLRIFQLLQQLQTRTLSPNLQDLPPAFLRLLSVLPRICREALRYQKYRDACIRARAELDGLRDPKRKLNDDERLAILDKVDEILGLAPIRALPFLIPLPNNRNYLNLNIPRPVLTPEPLPPNHVTLVTT